MFLFFPVMSYAYTIAQIQFSDVSSCQWVEDFLTSVLDLVTSLSLRSSVTKSHPSRYYPDNGCMPAIHLLSIWRYSLVQKMMDCPLLEVFWKRVWMAICPQWAWTVDFLWGILRTVLWFCSANFRRIINTIFSFTSIQNTKLPPGENLWKANIISGFCYCILSVCLAQLLYSKPQHFITIYFRNFFKKWFCFS